MGEEAIVVRFRVDIGYREDGVECEVKYRRLEMMDGWIKLNGLQ